MQDMRTWTSTFCQGLRRARQHGTLHILRHGPQRGMLDVCRLKVQLDIKRSVIQCNFNSKIKDATYICDDSQQLFCLLQWCSPICQVAKDLTKTSWNPICLSLQFLAMCISVTTGRGLSGRRTIGHVSSVKVCNFTCGILACHVAYKIWNGYWPKVGHRALSQRSRGRWMMRHNWRSRRRWRCRFIHRNRIA